MWITFEIICNKIFLSPFAAPTEHTPLAFALASDFWILALRGLFIIDPAGVIRSIQINDDAVGRSVEETLRILKAFQWADTHIGGVTSVINCEYLCACCVLWLLFDGSHSIPSSLGPNLWRVFVILLSCLVNLSYLNLSLSSSVLSCRRGMSCILDPRWRYYKNKSIREQRIFPLTLRSRVVSV